MTAWLPEHAGRVFQGTCGWSDPTILQCGRFYPSWVKTTEDRLRHFSTFFPCVECDTSNYAIPSPHKVERWLSCVPRGFIFHFKAFGFFTRKSAPKNSLPRVIRVDLSVTLQEKSVVKWDEMPVALREKVWELFNAALKPAHTSNKLGVVIFQFHIGFGPVLENKQHIMECRRLLGTDYKMAVEFRNRKWLSETELEKTLKWLRETNIGLVCTDELEHELLNLQAPLKASDAKVVPIVYELGSPSFSYVRVHRRAGKERLLTADQIKRWGERLRSEKIQRHIEGPIFFMWGTDHEDQPIINCKNLTAELGQLVFDLKLSLTKSSGSLWKFCSPKNAKPGADNRQSSIVSLDSSDTDCHTEEEKETRLPESSVVQSPSKKLKHDTQSPVSSSRAKNSPGTKKSKGKSPYTQTLKMTSFFSKQA